ncbi:hypothetical protein JTE90_004382 [Oedothorax gibbosus]|uniref:Uncharacterized protein n=1 Tax=Oedothorax gibbosus TaxID=931172 RepID=A0AAV6TKA2_9ARAC|nr:hypothetical protein JTE90_004382 [Oedothorax gibbosus]
MASFAKYLERVGELFCCVRKRKSIRVLASDQEKVASVSRPPKAHRRKKRPAPSPPKERVVPIGIEEGIGAYPEHLNPFFKDAGDLSPKEEYPEELNPFAGDDGEEEQVVVDVYPEELNPFRGEDGYPFGDGDGSGCGEDYPDHLNPFHTDEGDVDGREVKLSSPTAAPTGEESSPPSVPVPIGGYFEGRKSSKKRRAPSPPHLIM